MFDLVNKVVAIGISPVDSPQNEIGLIETEDEVTHLVQMILEGTVDHNATSRRGTYLLTFYLTDGTISQRSYDSESHLLHSRILLNPEFTLAIEEAISK